MAYSSADFQDDVGTMIARLRDRGDSYNATELARDVQSAYDATCDHLFADSAFCPDCGKAMLSGGHRLRIAPRAAAS